HLSQLADAREHLRFSVREVQIETDPVQPKLILPEFSGPANDVVDIDDLHVAAVCTSEPQNVLHNSYASLRFRSNLLQAAPVRERAFTDHEFRKSENRRQRIIQLMNNAGQQIAGG